MKSHFRLQLETRHTTSTNTMVKLREKIGGVVGCGADVVCHGVSG
jgi:hypothetical protein